MIYALFYRCFIEFATKYETVGGRFSRMMHHHNAQVLSPPVVRSEYINVRVRTRRRCNLCKSPARTYYSLLESFLNAH